MDFKTLADLQSDIQRRVLEAVRPFAGQTNSPEVVKSLDSAIAGVLEVYAEKKGPAPVQTPTEPHARATTPEPEAAPASDVDGEALGKVAHGAFWALSPLYQTPDYEMAWQRAAIAVRTHVMAHDPDGWCAMRAALMRATEEAAELRRQVHDAERIYEAAVHGLEADLAKAQAERNEAQHWRERHCRDSAAYAEQSQKNWQRAEAAEAELAEFRRTAHEIASGAARLSGDAYANGYAAGAESMRAALVADCDRLRGELAELRAWKADRRSHEIAADATIAKLRAELTEFQERDARAWATLHENVHENVRLEEECRDLRSKLAQLEREYQCVSCAAKQDT